MQGIRRRAARRRSGAHRNGTPRGLALAVAIAAAVLPGCVTQQGYLTLASTRHASIESSEIQKMDIETLPVVRDIEGSHTAITSVLFVPVFAGPHLELAVDEAIELGHGDLLTRARVQTTKWWFLVGVETLTVRGNVIDLPGEY